MNTGVQTSFVPDWSVSVLLLLLVIIVIVSAFKSGGDDDGQAG